MRDSVGEGNRVSELGTAAFVLRTLFYGDVAFSRTPYLSYLEHLGDTNKHTQSYSASTALFEL